MIKFSFTVVKITLFYGFCAIATIGFAQTPTSYNSTNDQTDLGFELFNRNPDFDQHDFSNYVRNASWLSLKKETLKRLYETQPQVFTLIIPLEDGTDLQIVLKRHQILTDDFSVRTTKGKTDYQKGLYYKGHLLRKNNTLAAISFFEDMVMGVVSFNGENYVLGHLYQDEFPAGEDYIFYKESDMLISSEFDCASDDLPIIDQPEVEIVESSTRNSSSNNVVRVYIEVDNQLYQNKGSNVGNTTNYITGFFNVVATLYSNESISTQISEIYVWTGNDPYPSNSSSAALDAFMNQVNGSFNGDLAHLVAYNPGQGGIAYVGVLCNPNFSVAYSSVGSSYSNFPTYSWTVEVFTHEMGHNLGSPHTHSCSWAGGAIDNCYSTEGNCSPGPAPTNGGTIMSYCHLTSTGINFNNGFGPLPGDRIRGEVAAASCLSSGGPMPNLTRLSDNYSLSENIISITHRVTNTGDATAAAHTVNYYLSTNTTITTNDILIGTRSVGALSAGSSTGNINYSVDINALDLSTGVYYVGYVIDAGGAVIEASESDNAFYWTNNNVNIQGYCETLGNNTQYEWIESISVGSFSYTSGNNGGYAYMDNLNPNIAKNTGLSLNLIPGYGGQVYAEYWRIWIDLNRDFDFDDPGELLFDSGDSYTNGITGSMTIPNSASTGETRMRVSMKWVDTGDTAPGTCETFTYGEVEDYRIIIVQNASMPLDLIDFSGEAQEKSNTLKWTTTNEQNTLHHILQRSTDGQHFETLTKVDAAGISTAPINYHWEDKSPELVAYYRLQTVDIDGATYFSDVIRLERKNSPIWSLDAIFPNPTASDVQIGFNAPEVGTVSIQVVDVMGKVWKNQQLKAMEGYNNLPMDLSELPSGVYFIIFESPEDRKVVKVSKE